MDYKFNEKSISKSEKIAFNMDQDYRYKYVRKYYSKLETCDSYDFLYFFCTHYNVNKLHEQIKPVFDSPVFDFKSMNYKEKFFKLCELFSIDIKKDFDNFPSDIRAKNIKQVNDKQIKDILKSRKANKLLKDILREDENSERKVSVIDRNLVMYFRRTRDGEEEVDYLEFSIMYYILNWYIKSGKSKIFNKLSIVSRIKDAYPHYLNYLFQDFVKIKTESREDRRILILNGDDHISQFEFSSSLGANIIHLADGGYDDLSKNCSIPIVTEAFRHLEKSFHIFTRIKSNYVIMDGIFYDKFNDHAFNNMNTIKEVFLGSRDRNTGNFITLMETVLKAVALLEDKMIKDCEGFGGGNKIV